MVLHHGQPQVTGVPLVAQEKQLQDSEIYTKQYVVANLVSIGTEKVGRIKTQ